MPGKQERYLSTTVLAALHSAVKGFGAAWPDMKECVLIHKSDANIQPVQQRAGRRTLAARRYAIHAFRSALQAQKKDKCAKHMYFCSL